MAEAPLDPLSNLCHSYILAAKMLNIDKIRSFELLGLVVGYCRPPYEGAPVNLDLISILNPDLMKLDDNEKYHKLSLGKELFALYDEIGQLTTPYGIADVAKVKKFYEMSRNPEYACLLRSNAPPTQSTVDQPTIVFEAPPEEVTATAEIPEKSDWPPPDVATTHHYAILLLGMFDKIMKDLQELTSRLVTIKPSIETEVNNVMRLNEYAESVALACELIESGLAPQPELVSRIRGLTEELADVITPPLFPTEKQIHPELLHNLSVSMGLIALSKEEPIVETVAPIVPSKKPSKHRSRGKKKRASSTVTENCSKETTTQSPAVSVDALPTTSAAKGPSANVKKVPSGKPRTIDTKKQDNDEYNETEF